MDSLRLDHLQKLAGLVLSADLSRRLQADLTAMEADDRGLRGETAPEVDGPGREAAGPACCPPPEEMDRMQVLANAPGFTGGYFRIPPVDTSNPEDVP